MEVSELAATERGDAGFGSTGLSAPCRADLGGRRGTGDLTKTERRTLADQISAATLEDIAYSHRAVTDREILTVLRAWSFKHNDRRKTSYPQESNGCSAIHWDSNDDEMARLR